MILTGSEIVAARNCGKLTIEPFKDANVNPNSYNYRLGEHLLVHSGGPIDPRRTSDADWNDAGLSRSGLTLLPGRLYLGSTVEAIGSSEFVPQLIGRSSMGRLGLYLEITAELGQLGAVHNWTLEIVVVQPLRVYPGMRIGQVSFWRPHGEKQLYDGYFGRFSMPTATPWEFLASDLDR